MHYNIQHATITMTDLKHLISPFMLVPSHNIHQSSTAITTMKKAPRQAPPCNCDSDDENDFGIAPECAFICNAKNHSPSPMQHKKSKKRRNAQHAMTKTKRNKP